jgi:hypothetical protein
MGIRDHLPPALVLLFLSPMIGELLSGSSPPTEFFTAFGFTVMTLLYGGGALLAREMRIRWGKGVGSLLLLGASYGVIEEGVMVGSWFNPAWPDLGLMGVFGRWLGVNWVWAVDLTIYHAIISITVPCMLVELAYPDRARVSWLSERWFKVVGVAFVVNVIIGIILFGNLTGYMPNLIHVLFAVILAGVFLLAAKRLPANWARNPAKPVRRASFYFLYTFLSSLACVAVFYVLPHLVQNPLGPVVVIVLGTTLIFTLIMRLRRDWGPVTLMHKLAICAGSLGLLILLTPIQEFDATRIDDTAGMVAVGLMAVTLLLLLWRDIKRTTNTPSLVAN